MPQIIISSIRPDSKVQLIVAGTELAKTWSVSPKPFGKEMLKCQPIVFFNNKLSYLGKSILQLYSNLKGDIDIYNKIVHGSGKHKLIKGGQCIEGVN